MIEIINTVLQSQGLGEVRSGKIVKVSEQVSLVAAEAMRAFLDFGGKGWLCTAESAAILHSAPGGNWPPLDTAWPLHGELAKEEGGRKLSLHLRRTPQGWNLVELEETADEEGKSCLIKTALHRHKEKTEEITRILLCYTVAWAPMWIGDDTHGHEELRPTVYRFAGFATKEVKP